MEPCTRPRLTEGQSRGSPPPPTRVAHAGVPPANRRERDTTNPGLARRAGAPPRGVEPTERETRKGPRPPSTTERPGQRLTQPQRLSPSGRRTAPPRARRGCRERQPRRVRMSKWKAETSPTATGLLNGQPKRDKPEGGLPTPDQDRRRPGAVAVCAGARRRRFGRDDNQTTRTEPSTGRPGASRKTTKRRGKPE